MIPCIPQSIGGLLSYLQERCGYGDVLADGFGKRGRSAAMHRSLPTFLSIDHAERLFCDAMIFRLAAVSSNRIEV
jgi:hypothetical protein